MDQKILYVVGIGPGTRDMRTIQADRILSEAEVIAGYSVYNDLVREDYPQAEFLTTPMRKERERCILALEKAAEGRTCALICSGDPGVYGMAGLLLELRDKQFPDVQVKVIPGVTAALSGAALLGSPLGHDFAVISLSDALTPWETIRACGILLQALPENTICGIAENIGRDGEACRVMTLKELSGETVTMFSTVFIGSPETRGTGGCMVTPRGYEKKEQQ